MRWSFPSAHSAWRRREQEQLSHFSERSAPQSMTSVIVCWACAICLTIGLSRAASAQDLSSAIALPDQPFIIPPKPAPHNVLTQLNNNARQGAYLAETSLNPTNVKDGTFGWLQQRMIQGQVLAQPLYVRDVDIQDWGRKSLVVVATAANYVYALDVNDLQWGFFRQLTPVRPVDPINNNSNASVCAETYPPYIGITSTPVIDDATGDVFVVSYNSYTAKQELHKLNLHDEFRSDVKVEINPSGPGTGEGRWPKYHRNRPGLLLSNGIIYVAFGSFTCDGPQPFSGWVIGYSEDDLHQVSQWDTPNFGSGSHDIDNGGGSSGIWQSGRGLVASDRGDIYFMTGNDMNLSKLEDHTNSAAPYIDFRLANSFVHLRPSTEPCVDFNRDKQGLYDCGLTLEGSFNPKNTSQLSAGDTDLGSSGPILLPGDILVGGGKEGRVYVLNASTMQLAQDNMADDGSEGFQAFFNNYHNTQNSRGTSPTCTAKFDNGNAVQYCKTLHKEDLLKNRRGTRPPVGIETVVLYPGCGRERPSTFWWRVTP